MADNALISLAVLKVNWDRNRQSYIDNFVPFVAECIRVQETEVVSTPEVQQAIGTSFRLRIPQNVIGRILTRARRFGYVHVRTRLPLTTLDSTILRTT